MEGRWFYLKGAWHWKWQPGVNDGGYRRLRNIPPCSKQGLSKHFSFSPQLFMNYLTIVRSRFHSLLSEVLPAHPNLCLPTWLSLRHHTLMLLYKWHHLHLPFSIFLSFLKENNLPSWSALHRIFCHWKHWSVAILNMYPQEIPSIRWRNASEGIIPDSWNTCIAVTFKIQFILQANFVSHETHCFSSTFGTRQRNDGLGFLSSP